MSDLRISAMLRWLAMVAGLMVLGSCVVVEEGPRPLPPDGPRFCTREYAPVCARRGGDRQTFSNACEADAAGYRVIRPGECRRDVPGPIVEEPQICTQEYDPVCAERRGNRRTFGNACTADAEGYRVIGRGECRRGFDEEEMTRACPRIYRPVCGRRRGAERTFPNSCEAERADFRIVADGPC
jgi:hypothetical protein